MSTLGRQKKAMLRAFAAREKAGGAVLYWTDHASQWEILRDYDKRVIAVSLHKDVVLILTRTDNA